MAALGRVRADAPGQADQRRVAGEHVAHPELGHRQVEHRMPRPAVEAGHGDDQRQPDEQRGHRDGPERDPTPPPLGRAGSGLGTRPRARPGSRSPSPRSLAQARSVTRRDGTEGPGPPPGMVPTGSVSGHRGAADRRPPRAPGHRGPGRGQRADRRPRRSHGVRARRVGRPAAAVAGRPRDVARHRHRRRARGDPAPWPLPLHGRDDGRGLHALLPRAHRPTATCPTSTSCTSTDRARCRSSPAGTAVFGHNLAAERTFGLLQHLGILLALFALARAWGRVTATAVAALAVFYVLTPIGLTAMAWNGGVALLLWSVVFAVRACTSPTRDDSAGRGSRRASWPGSPSPTGPT